MCANKLSRRIVDVGAAKQSEPKAVRLQKEFPISQIHFLLSDLIEAL